MSLPRIADILTAASRLSGVPVETILHGGRSRQYVHLRAAVAIVARRFVAPRTCHRYSYPEIAQALDYFDHTTVIHLVQSAGMYAKRDSDFAPFVERLHAAVQSDELFASDEAEQAPPAARRGYEALAKKQRRLVRKHQSTSRKAGRNFAPSNGEDADAGHIFHARIAAGSKAFAAALAAARST